MFHVTPQSGPGLIKPARKAVYHNRVQPLVDDVLDLTHHPRQSCRRQPAFEYRELDALAILLADLSDPSEPTGAFTVGVGNVVGNEDVH